MKMCPQCQSGYDESYKDCPDCGCRLLTEHGPDESYPWTCVATLKDEAVAKAAALHLSEHDVPTVLQPRFDAIFARWNAVELWVPEHMAPEAATLLSAPGGFQIEHM